MLKKILAVALMFGIAACGNKAAKKVTTLSDEHNSLTTYMNATHPDSTWNAASLNEFEAKLNRLADVRAQLRRMDGRDGVRMKGGVSQEFLAYKRDGARARPPRKPRKRVRPAPRSSPTDERAGR